MTEVAANSPVKPAVHNGSSRRAAAVFVAGLLGLFLTGCSPSTSGQTPDLPRPTVSPGGSSCGDRATRDLLNQFLAAFNSGDIGQLDSLVSTRAFVWWSTDAPGRRIDPDARDRTTLMDYFASRHRQRDHLNLKAFRYNGQSGNVGNFELSLVRTADDLSAPTAYDGKGAVDCSRLGLSVWSMARNP